MRCNQILQYFVYNRSNAKLKANKLKATRETKITGGQQKLRVC